MNVTKELSEKIKELRLINKVKAIDVAEHIEKSPAYVSKLENGDIKTINYDELLKILTFISKSPEDLENFIDKLSLKLTPDERKEMIWLLNFDTVERSLPIPGNLIDYLNDKLSALGVDIPELVDYVNRNESITDIIEKHNIDTSKYKSNYWYPYDCDDKLAESFIIMRLIPNEIAALLEKKIDTTNYVTIESLLFNLLRLEYGKENPISKEKNNELRNETTKILNSFKFYNSIEKNKLLKASTTKQELEALLSDFDIENRKLVNEFLEYISFLSDWNVKYTNEKMSLLNKNLDWDASYILTLASLPYFEIGGISKSLKSNLLNDIKELIEEYKKKPEQEKTIEEY